MDLNPVLSEIQNLSPSAKGALGMAGHTLPDAPPIAPTLSMPGPLPSPLLTPSTPPTVEAPRGTIQGDTNARGALLGSKSGVDSISDRIQGSGFGQAHPLLGKIAGGVAQGAGLIGDQLLRAAAPGIESHVPGTEGNYSRQLQGANVALNQDEKNADEEATAGNLRATAAHTQEETAEAPQKAVDAHSLGQAQVENLESEVPYHNAQASALLHPQAKTDFEAWQVQNPGKPIEEWLKAKTAASDKPDPLKQQYVDEYQKQHPGASVAQALHQYAADTQAPQRPPIINVNAGNAALDRETTRMAKPYEKGVAEANSQLEKIADARTMVNGSAEAQALGIPKVLTALVSGAGSGVRITQPELNAIAKARGLSGDVEGTLNSWAGKGKLTPTQQQQLTGILDDVKKRIEAKRDIHSNALDAINSGASRDDIIKADHEARQKINDLESRSGQSQHKVGDPVMLNGQKVTIKAIHPDGTFEY